jgi:hypothetical protein
MIGSFFFIDAVGRRKSLFIGASLQMVSDIYIGTYLKYRQDSSVSDESSHGAIAFIFIHAFGYVIGKSRSAPGIPLLTSLQGFSFCPTSLAASSGPTGSAPLEAHFRRAFTGCSSTLWRTAPRHCWRTRTTGAPLSSLPGGVLSPSAMSF